MNIRIFEPSDAGCREPASDIRYAFCGSLILDYERDEISAGQDESDMMSPDS
ncbi:MAG: hypothetical protein LBC98_07605 [Prevotellaceae bacterium]|nr:hypothetical protein [Prevotellaceae bacterium]